MRTAILTTIALSLLAMAPAKSLWTSKRNSERGMFADRTAANIGDILLVTVEEETIVNRSSSKNSATNTNIGYGMGTLELPHILDKISAADFPVIGMTPSDSFSGSGSVSDANVVEAKIAVQVVDVLPNGNLLIEGARMIKASGETQYIVLTGSVRGDDVGLDNTILSYKIVNARVEIFGEGDLENAQRKNWIHKMLDAVNIY